MTAITFNEILKAEQTPTGCGVLVLRDGKVLAGSRIERAGKGKLCGPGGHIEPGETPEEGARREAYEEFGIICNELVPLGVQTGRGSHGRSAVFLCSDFTGEPKTDEEEMTEPQWIRPEEIAEEEAYPPFFQSLDLLPEEKEMQKTKKSMDFNIYKTDDDQRLVFGWASVAITVDGEVLEDRQEDMIDPEELEMAAYEYVLNFRDTGEEHLPGYRKKGKLVESCVFTQEKQRAMGIPEGILPVAWWIGFKIDDEATWQRIKDGTYKMFSIEGKAQREPVEKAERNYEEFPEYNMWLEENLDATIEEQKAAEEWYKKNRTAKSFDEVLKFNPYHDALGRFSSSGGATFMTVFTNSPAVQKAIANIKAKQMAAQQAAAAAAPPAPAKPKVNYDAKGFADHDDADYHQLYNRKQYFQQQQLTAQQKKSADAYVDPDTEIGSLYNVAQNMNWSMVNGQKLSPKHQQVHDDMLDSMHNIGYNVNLTRYDHAGMVNSMLQGLGAGSDYTRMSQSQLKKALVGQSMGESKMISTTTNDFSNAPRNVQNLFRDRAVKINYKTKANVQGLLMPIGSGGDQGELVLAPTAGKSAKNAAPRITDVRYTGKTVYRAKTGRSYPQIEIDVEWD